MDLKTRLVELYRSGFNDSEEYVRYFFERKYREEYVVPVFDGGELVSALYLFPRRIYLGGRVQELGFISAAATFPEFRGKNYIGAAIEEACARLKESGVSFCALHPFKNSYYYRHSFEDYTWVSGRKVPAAGGQAPKAEYTLIDYSEGYLDDILGLYREFCDGFEGYVVRDAADMAAKIEECKADGGRVVLVKSGGGFAGYVFINGNEAEECCFPDFKAGGSFLLDGIAEFAGLEYTVPARAGGEGTRPYAMIRPLDPYAEAVLSGIADRKTFNFDKY